jgi:glutamate carboxypeptidase
MDSKTDVKSIVKFCVGEQDWLLETLETLVRLESPSTDKQAVDRCGAELEHHLRTMGARIARLERAERGDHLRAEFGSGLGQVLVLTHFDTVWPVGQLDRMPLRREGGRLYGPGVYDMKGGLTIAVLAIRALLAVAPSLLPRLVLLLTTDEETGSPTSRSIIEDEARQSDAVLVLEPSMPESGAVKTARKGCATFELRVRGVAAHSGEPEQGASAVLELAEQLLAIERFGHLDRDVSITACMAGGGARTNVVPEEAWALFDVRVPTLADAAQAEAALRALQPRRARTQLALSGGLERPPLERTPAVVRLFEMARSVAAEIGLELGEGGSSGVSDGNFTAALGVPTLDGLGAIGAGAHALDEHVEIAALAPRAALVAGLLARLGAR